MPPQASPEIAATSINRGVALERTESPQARIKVYATGAKTTVPKTFRSVSGILERSQASTFMPNKVSNSYTPPIKASDGSKASKVANRQYCQSGCWGETRKLRSRCMRAEQVS